MEGLTPLGFTPFTPFNTPSLLSAKTGAPHPHHSLHHHGVVPEEGQEEGSSFFVLLISKILIPVIYLGNALDEVLTALLPAAVAQSEFLTKMKFGVILVLMATIVVPVMVFLVLPLATIVLISTSLLWGPFLMAFGLWYRYSGVRNNNSSEILHLDQNSPTFVHRNACINSKQD